MCYQGTIRNLKAFYRHSNVKRYITSIDGGRSQTKVIMLEVMTLLTAAWECVSPLTLVNCFRKAGISSESQAQSQSDDDDLFKLLAAHLEEFQGRCESPLDFTVDGYVQIDVNKDVITLEVHFLTDSEIILEFLNRSLMQQKMMMKMRMQIGKCHLQGGVKSANEILQSCCLYHNDGEQKMPK